MYKAFFDELRVIHDLDGPPKYTAQHPLFNTWNRGDGVDEDNMMPTKDSQETDFELS